MFVTQKQMKKVKKKKNVVVRCPRDDAQAVEQHCRRRRSLLSRPSDSTYYKSSVFFFDAFDFTSTKEADRFEYIYIMRESNER